MAPAVWLIVGIGGAVLFGPKFGSLSLFKKAPPTNELQIVKSQLDEAKAKQLAAELELAKAKKEKEEKLVLEVRSAQKNNEGTIAALGKIPDEHKTPASDLATSFANRTAIRLSSAIGSLPDDQKQEILAIVDQALSKVEAERDAARLALAKEDIEFKIVSQRKDQLEKEIPVLQTNLDSVKADVAVKDAKNAKLTNQVASYAEKKYAAEERAGSLEHNFFTLLYWSAFAVLLYVLIHWIIPSLAQEFPGVSWLSSLWKTTKSISSTH